MPDDSSIEISRLCATK